MHDSDFLLTKYKAPLLNTGVKEGKEIPDSEKGMKELECKKLTSGANEKRGRKKWMKYDIRNLNEK